MTPSALEIRIRPRRNGFLLFFLGFWLAGWAVGEAAALSALLQPGGTAAPWLLAAGLSLWTAAGGFALYAWLWQLAGREVVTVGASSLVLRRALLGPGRPRRYDLAKLENLRVAPPAREAWRFPASLAFWGLAGGAVAFDRGGRTHRFGLGLDEAEAADLVRRLRERLPPPAG